MTDKDPGRTPSQEKGADTQRRFRYQATYAAIVSLQLLEPESGVVQVFCEHHEDVLVKLEEGIYIGIQVKTREPHLGPFRARNPEMIRTLQRFARLERDFPERFRTYVVGTNCGFLETKNDGSNLRYLIGLSREQSEGGADLPEPLAAYVQHVTDSTDLQEEDVVATAAKTRLEVLPGLDDIELRVVRLLSRTELGRGKRYDDLKRLAEALTEYAFRAGSLVNNTSLRECLAFMEDPETAEAEAQIRGKLITRDVIEGLMQESLVDESLLRTWRHIPVRELPMGMRVMELKMTAGGASVQDIDLAKDHKYSLEVLLHEWMYAKGTDEAQKRYEHLRTLVRTECQEAHDSFHDAEGLFGQGMLVDIRNRLRASHERGNRIPFNIRYEHLLGMAGLLTEDCTIWWSDPFVFPEEVIG